MKNGLPYMIWWLSRNACQQVNFLLGQGNEVVANLPPYILCEVWKRFGHPGRGQLSVAPHIPVKEVTEWKTGDGVDVEALDCGGIVIEQEHVNQIVGLPGFITDLSLNIFTLDEGDGDGAG